MSIKSLKQFKNFGLNDWILLAMAQIWNKNKTFEKYQNDRSRGRTTYDLCYSFDIILRIFVSWFDL